MFGVCLFSYLLGNVSGLLAQIYMEECINLKQTEELEEWLIRINRLGKTKSMRNKDIKFITDYMKSDWRKDIKWLLEGNNFMFQLSPVIRRKVLLYIIFSY